MLLGVFPPSIVLACLAFFVAAALFELFDAHAAPPPPPPPVTTRRNTPKQKAPVPNPAQKPHPNSATTPPRYYLPEALAQGELPLAERLVCDEVKSEAGGDHVDLQAIGRRRGETSEEMSTVPCVRVSRFD